MSEITDEDAAPRCPNCGQRGWVVAGDRGCQQVHDGEHLRTGCGDISPEARCKCGLRYGDFLARQSASVQGRSLPPGERMSSDGSFGAEVEMTGEDAAAVSDDDLDRAARSLRALCICPRFSDTGGFRIADLGCPVHGLEGPEPGDGYWPDEEATDGS